MRRYHFKNSGVLFPVLVLILTPCLANTGVWARKPPGFTLDRLDGGVYNLKDDLGKSVILLQFWGMCCHAKLSNLRTIDELYLQYKDKGLKVYGINIDDAASQSGVKPAVKKYGFSFPILLDPAQEVLRKYSPFKMNPYTVIIDLNGEIVHELGGNQSKYHELIMELLPDGS